MRDGRATYRLWRVRARVAFLSSRAPVARTDANAHYSRRRALSARLPEVLELPERLRVGCGGTCHRIVSEDELRAVAPVVPQYRGGFVSSCGWLRHRPGGVGLRSERAGVTGPWGRRLRGTRGPARSREQLWERKSVHRSAKMTSRSRFGAFVYTVAPLWAGAGTQECTQIGENGLSVSFWDTCVHCCDARVARVATRAASSGTSAPTTMACRRRPLGGRLSSGRENRSCASGAAASLASSPRRQPTQTPEELFSV